MHKDHSLALQANIETDFPHEGNLVGQREEQLQWQPLSAFDISKVFISSNQLVTTMNQPMKSPSQPRHTRACRQGNCGVGNRAASHHDHGSQRDMEVLLNTASTQPAYFALGQDEP